MALMPVSRLEQIKDALATRMLTFFQATQLTLAPHEFITTYIKPEHVSVLQTTRDICGDIGSQYGLDVSQYCGEVSAKATIHFAFVSEAPIIIPQYVSTEGAQSNANPDTVAKINTWLAERWRQGVLMGDALEGLRWLNDKCLDFRAMAALFPAITILMRDLAGENEKSGLAKTAARIQTNGTVKSLPRLPRAVKDRLLDASELLTATTLLSDVKFEKPTEKGYSVLSLRPAYQHSACKRPSQFYEDHTTQEFV